MDTRAATPGPAGTRKLGYARRGLDDQLAQLNALRKAGAATIHTDPIDGRTAFEAMMQDLRPEDTLVVWKLDRLGRSLAELLHAITQIETLGVRLIVLVEHIDTATIRGRQARRLLASLVKLERGLAHERAALGSSAGGRRGPKRVLTPERIGAARRLLGTGMKPPEVAKKIGVSKSTLYAAMRGPMAVSLDPHHDSSQDGAPSVVSDAVGE